MLINFSVVENVSPEVLVILHAALDYYFSHAEKAGTTR